jgi:hypothetical protein
MGGPLRSAKALLDLVRSVEDCPNIGLSRKQYCAILHTLGQPNLSKAHPLWVWMSYSRKSKRSSKKPSREWKWSNTCRQKGKARKSLKHPYK